MVALVVVELGRVVDQPLELGLRLDPLQDLHVAAAGVLGLGQLE